MRWSAVNTLLNAVTAAVMTAAARVAARERVGRGRSPAGPGRPTPRSAA